MESIEPAPTEYQKYISDNCWEDAEYPNRYTDSTNKIWVKVQACKQNFYNTLQEYGINKNCQKRMNICYVMFKNFYLIC